MPRHSQMSAISSQNYYTGSFIRNEPISQYASNAACHYKERSLTFQIVASRVLSRAPSTPPADSIRPAAHSICHASLRMAKSVLCPWVGAHQFCGHSATCSTGPLRWFQQLQDMICCNAFGRNSPIALMLSVLLVVVILRGSIHVSWYYWLLGKYDLIKSVHSL
jgi:hypothetical protein